MKTLAYYLFLSLCIFFSCSPQKEAPEEAVAISSLTWKDIQEQSKGSQVTWMMWQGDPFINKYVREYVTPQLKERYNIDLQVVNGQGNQVVNLLLSEKEAGTSQSQIDLCWINGETFFQLRQLDALYGPFVSKLPNSQYIDWNNPFIAYDFQQKVDGYECPWGNVQMAMIYNSDQVSAPPMNLEELESWVKANPGKFTISNDFTGMTLLKSWLMDFAGGANSLAGEFNEELYREKSKALWAYINRIKPYFWNNGESFPTNTGQMHQLFASGELWFTMSNNDGEVDNKITQGLFPENTRAYVPAIGSIQNSHYLGLVKNAPHKAAALVAINFLISPEAQWEKMKPSVWGDGTVLDAEKLSPEWQDKFQTVPGRVYAPKRADIQDKALMEPAATYMLRLFSDFRKHVIQAS